ncbi:ABC transporter permease [Candidatus Bathyarchaeota archaeon]|nr:ABC transporter permease [Candidatus Bathyarchaeota archaeon]
MEKPKVRKGMLSSIIPGLSSLSQRGLAGWLVVLGFTMVVSIVTITAISPWVAPYDPSAINVGTPLMSPNSQFLFGTNDLGQDVFSRVLSGGGIMLEVSILSVIICLLVGVPLGLFSSYAGGVVDRFFCLIMDSIYAFPGLVLAIAIAAMLGRGVTNMALSIAVVYVPSYFRVIRSQVLSIKEMPYVEAANAAGAKGRTILSRYVFPNVVPSIVVIATVNFADAILTAAGLTFIGLGVSANIPDWGWDLTNGRRLLSSGTWWVITFPGLMIILLALGFTLMGEGLSEMANPRLRE